MSENHEIKQVVYDELGNYSDTISCALACWMLFSGNLRFVAMNY